MSNNIIENIPTISLEDAIASAPAIAATAPDHRVTERYQFLSTREVLDAFIAEGWNIRDAQSRRPRAGTSLEHAKHLVRLFHPDYTIGDSVAELVVINSHDRSSSIQFRLGVFRFVCANGLIVGDTFETIKTRHLGDARIVVDDAIGQFSDIVPRIAAKAEEWAETEVDREEYGAGVVEQFIAPRLEKAGKRIIDAEAMVAELVEPTREADAPANLWAVFNTVQEKMVRGGVRYTIDTGKRHRDGSPVIRLASMRGITNIDTGTRINSELWDYTENYAVAA